MKSSSKKITLEGLRKFIVEKAYRILKEEGEFDDNTEELPSDELGNGEENYTEPASSEVGVMDKEDFSNLSAKVNQLAQQIGQDELIDLDEIIERAKTKGRISENFNFNSMISPAKRDSFNYVTTALATLYHDESTSESEKINIEKVLRETMNRPYELTSYGKGEGGSRPSILSNMIAKRAKIVNLHAKSQTIDGSYIKEIIADAIYEAVDYTLQNFNKTKGGTFPYFVLVKATHITIDSIYKTKATKTSISRGFGGGEFLKSSSIDDPLGDSVEDSDSTKADRFTGGEGKETEAQKLATKELADTVKNFVLKRLAIDIKNKDANPAFLKIAELLLGGESLATISDALNTLPGTIRANKSRLEAFITENYVQTGIMQKYIKDKIGVQVNFPNNKFFIAVQGTEEDKKVAEENPLEYFEQKGVDPETGEPKGEWVPVKIGKGDKKSNNKGFVDYGSYGDFDPIRGDAETRFTKGAEKPFEPEIENPEDVDQENLDDLGPDDQALTEELMRRVNKRILREEIERKLFLINPDYFKETIVPQEGRTKTHEQILKELREQIIKNGIKKIIAISYSINGYSGDALFEHVPTDDDKIKYEFTGTAA